MRHRLGSVEEFDRRRLEIREAGGRSVGVFRDDDDSFYAVLNVCPHRGAPVCRGVLTGTMLPSAPGTFVPGLEGHVLRCPWHAWEYDVRSGESIGPVDRRNLTTYPVTVEGGVVYAEIGAG